MRVKLILAALLAGRAGLASGTMTWEMNTYEDFLKGRFEGVSLSRDGAIQLAPKVETLFSLDQPAVWSVARAADGTMYLGTGHRGQVYRVDASGEATLVWTADEPEVFAVAVDGKGRLYAATSPNGKVYRIENGGAREYFNPGATYIWALAFAEDGALFVGTGDEGKIFRVDPSGRGEVYYETGQSHVTSLALTPDGKLLAGTEPNGILYRIGEKGKAFVLYDANLPEIRALAPMADGTIYAAALGGSLAKRTTAALTAPVKAPSTPVVSTSVTVTAAQGGVEIKPKPEPAKPAAVAAPAAPAMPVVELTGIEKSALYRIHADNTVETLWSSTEENAYDLLPSGDKIIFSTDRDGRLYELDAARKVTLLAQTNESEAVRLLPSGEGLLVATANMGKVYRLGRELAASGVYEAPVHDAGRVARWGRLSWQAESEPGCSVTFQTRTGNSARPDETWSEWSEPLADGSGSQISSPNARFIQWRTKLSGTAGNTPVLHSVTLAYLPANSTPRVTNISISSQAAPTPAAASQPAQSTDTSAYSITVTDTGQSGASTVSGTATQKLTKSSSDQLQITWQAEDADGDKLTYSLYFRGEGEREWKLMKSDLEEAKYALDSDTLADGKYFFRVQVSDRLVNPPQWARESDRVGGPVLVDHTPPVVTIAEPRRSPDEVTVAVGASDAASALRRCEYSLDAGPWTPVAAQDGIIDSRQETFEIRPGLLAAGEHLLVVRVYDSANNAGLAKVVLR